MTALRQILLTAFLIFALSPCEVSAKRRVPRVIITTDGEIDDRRSMIRFLLYANEFDVKGLIHSSSKFHWKGNDSVAGHNWKDVSWLDARINAYEKVFPNLRQHDAAYPEPAHLRSQVFIGNVETVGDMNKATPGSNHIVKVLLEPDTVPVWLLAWGGTNTIARALKSIQENYPERMKEVSDKARLFMIIEQDDTYKEYIKPNWPGIKTIISYKSFVSVAYSWKKVVPQDYHLFFSGEWMRNNILSGDNSLCDLYEHPGDYSFRSEGDSPSFMYLIDVGLGDPESPFLGSWGGRFVSRDSVWTDATDDGDIHKPVYRWIPHFQNDFAARVDWCSKQVEKANHPPLIRLSKGPVLQMKPGGKIHLDAAGSVDVDGDRLTFRWWPYPESNDKHRTMSLRPTRPGKATLRIGKDVKRGDTIHVICEVSDSGYPVLTRYKRITVQIL